MLFRWYLAAVSAVTTSASLSSAFEESSSASDPGSLALMAALTSSVLDAVELWSR
jgi:hypothetical protein